MSSPKQLLVSCVTLLCLEHRPDSPASPSTELIDKIVGSLEIKETTVDHDHGRQTFLELRKLVQDLNKKVKHEFPSIAEVLQSVQVSCREENYLYEAVLNGVNENFPDGMAIMHRINSYRRSLNEYINDETIKAIMKEYSTKLLFNRGGGNDIAGMINEMGAKLDPYVKARAESRHPAEMGCLDFDNPEGVEEFFEAVQTTLSADGAFKLGWKGFNRVLGSLGAFRRGEFITTAALQHNFKSYLVMLLFVHVALFNKPWMRDKSKKPLLLFATLENEISDNLLTIYKYIRENETGEEVIVKDIDKREAAAYVCARLEENGFKVKMVRFDPTEFTIGGFTNYLDGLQGQGYEIQFLVVDYLNMLPKTGLDAKVAGDDIRLLFRRMRNYTTPRGITFISPHQLGSDALQLMRENTEDFVKVVANKGYYDGCRRLGQEPDLELFHHIIRHKGKAYLAIQRGKHRNTVTAEEDQYVLLPFSNIGTIPWDIDKEEDYSLKVVPGSVIGGDLDSDAWSI
ncbi:putative helicase [Pseudomonas phage PA1C]|nr:putative helicase [Pseudomonas phage PA1C]BEG72383.1 hypothetical protein RVBP21_0110 [Pseudomonas phage BRkr]